MKIGLIDVDGHNFPNLALMRISAYHKLKGDSVEWWVNNVTHYDIVYMSKIFSDAYSQDIAEPINTDRLYKGGTGYAISLIDEQEVYDASKDKKLPLCIEKMFPDYSIYPECNFAVSMTSRGCPRGCAFCHVVAKEGRQAKKVADVKDFWNGQKEIKILDPNITALKEKDFFDLMGQYSDTSAWCDFSQGVDARLLTQTKIKAFNQCKIKMIHFAWDYMEQSDAIIKGLDMYATQGKIQSTRNRRVYVLTNFDTTTEQDLYRIYTLKSLNYDPYVMIYNKPSAPKITKMLQRWVNNKFIFRTCDKFEEYEPYQKYMEQESK